MASQEKQASITTLFMKAFFYGLQTNKETKFFMQEIVVWSHIYMAILKLYVYISIC